MKLPRRFLTHLFCLTVICYLIDPIVSAPTKTNSETKKSATTSGDTVAKLTGSQTVIRPTQMFQSKEQLDAMPRSDRQRDIRPFEWLYKHLNEYLICEYGGHKDCEHKLAGAITMDDLNNKLNEIRRQNMDQQYPMEPQGPIYLGPQGDPRMWSPNHAHGPFMMGPFQADRQPDWRSQRQGPMGMMNGPNLPPPMGPPGPMNFGPEQPQMPMQRMPQEEQPFREPGPMLLSLRTQQQQPQFDKINTNMQNNKFIGTMNSDSKKTNNEKTRANQWMNDENQYPGMMSSPMFRVPAFVAQ